MKLIALLLFLVILTLFLFVSVVLLFHLSKYRMNKEHHTVIMTTFIIGSLILSALEFSVFFAIDWDGISQNITNNPKVNIERSVDGLDLPFQQQ